MTQSKLESLIESGINVVIGYITAIIAQLIIFPLMGIHITLSENLWMGLWFTIISLIRSYAIRRYFNQRLHNAAVKMAHALEEQK